MGVSFSYIDDIFLCIGINDEQRFYSTSYMKSFALSYGEKMGAFVLAYYFSVLGGIMVFFREKFQLVLITFKASKYLLVVIARPSRRDLDNISLLWGELLL